MIIHSFFLFVCNPRPKKTYQTAVFFNQLLFSLAKHTKMEMFRLKCNERQRRVIHEREYWKYISNLRRQSFPSKISYLPIEHIRDGERSRMRNTLHRQNQYERIQRENDRLSQRISQARGQLMTKEECQKDWQRHVQMMKKTSNYPENIDRFTNGLSTKVLRLYIEKKKKNE